MDVAALLSLLVADPGRPRLTWYGPAGERIELSGHVLDNWVTKTTNLLLEEYDVGPGSRVRLDLPPHWRTVVWALGVWRAGGCVVLGSADDVDLLVTHRPDDAPAGVDVVAVALPALARAFDGHLPPGAVDAASAVMTYPDALTWLPAVDPAAPALATDDDVVPHADLPDWAGTATAGRPTDEPGSRLLLETTGDTSAASVLGTALAVYAADGSLVLCDPEVSAGLAADPARRERLVASERTTA
ncbi:TIGR03089 family protein [Cellulomonas sp. APG4]|uniref:TIGR03089 family protein n=1 Tax=Cellulomonas sp. APG4 TaxID=1538656 RepID=UPI001379E0B0|nr:TIGR03089 family protein [Cellulomonas sp. APG4]NCT91343.1 TIGR03089 family protein [Cellulomonas sp. APG4]